MNQGLEIIILKRLPANHRFEREKEIMARRNCR